MGRNLNDYCGSRSRLLNVTKREMSLVISEVVILSGFVDTTNSENPSVSSQMTIEVDFITGQVVVTDEGLSGLIHIESPRQFLSAEVDREGVSSVIGEMHLSDFNGVISQEVVPDELQIVRPGEEPEHFAIKVQELLLRRNATSTELLLKVLE